MKSKMWPLAAIGMLLMTGNAPSASTQDEKPIIASYYSGTGSPEKVAEIPVGKLSHVLYAFLTLCGDHQTAGPTASARVATACAGKPEFTATRIGGPSETEELVAFETLKAEHPHLKVLASFGGWNLSAPFRQMAKSDAGRRRFVSTAIEIIQDNPAFDGIDIDWEYPGGGDNSSPPLGPDEAATERYAFRAMMRELRIGLDRLSVKTGRPYSVSAAVSGADQQAASIDWTGTAPYMNMVFAMTYDFAVGDGAAAHHANLYPVPGKTILSGAEMIENLHTAGIPADKLVLGVAFYARGWKGAQYRNGAVVTRDASQSIGAFRFRDLQANPPDGYKYAYDTDAEAAFLINRETGGFISFDDPRSIAAKTDFVREKGLAGIFSWQVEQDNGALLDAMHEGLAE